jgi:hypothetical protein
MTDKHAQMRELARGLIRDSVIEDAIAQKIALIIEHIYDTHIKPLQQRVEMLERERADLVEAAIKRALEGAAAHIGPHPDHDRADWTEYAHHAHRLAQSIRALDPAQFIEEMKG